MKKKTMATGLVCLLCLALLCTSFALLGQRDAKSSAQASGATVTTGAPDILDEYDYGDTVSLPTTVAVSYNGGNYTGEEGVLEYPDGSSRAISGTLSLNVLGEYAARYYFTDANDVRRSAEKRFTVSRPHFTLSSENGSRIEAGNGELPMKTAKNGVQAFLNDGCTLLYHKPIDLRNAGTDSLAAVVSLDPRLGERDATDKLYPDNNSIAAKRVTIRLTDCYDSNVYVDIQMQFYMWQVGNTGRWQSYSYYRAGGNNQMAKGLKKDATAAAAPGYIEEVYIDGDRYLAYLGSYGYGTSGVSPTQTDVHDGTQFWYDNEKNEVYVSCSAIQNGDKILVNQLCNTDLYGTETFGGFTTGEVYLSVSFSDYSQSTACMDIMSVGDDNGGVLEQQLTYNYKDEVLPVVTADIETTEGSTVYASVGDTFVLPAATARDVNLAGDVRVNVYTGYGASGQQDVGVQNGAFTVAKSETYYVVYTVRDAYGNEGTYILHVVALSSGNGSQDPAVLSVDKAITFSVDKLTALTAGVPVTLPAIGTLSTVNRTEALAATVAVSVGGKNVPVADGAFNPLQSGTYTVTYTVSDNAVSYTASYTVECTPNDVVSFVELPVLAHYYIKGARYDIPAAYGYTFGAQGAQRAETAKTYIKFDGGAFTELTSLYKVKIEAENEVTVKYELSNGTSRALTSDVADVHYESGLMMGEYFLAEGFDLVKKTNFVTGDETIEIDNPNVQFRAKEPYDEDHFLEFINPLLLNVFNFGFSVPGANGVHFSAVNVIIADNADGENAAVFTFANVGNTVQVSVNGGTVYTLSGYTADDSRRRTISYDATRDLFTVCSQLRFANPVSFSSPFVRMGVEMTGVTASDSILLEVLNGQALSGAVHADRTAPMAVYAMDNGNKVGGTTVTVYAPTVGDVLSPVSVQDVKVTVMSGSSYVTATDGTVLDGTHNDPTVDYQVKLSDTPANYTVTITATDGVSGRTFSESYNIYVVDHVAPTVTFTDGYTSRTVVKVAQGTELTVNFTVTDNDTPNENITVMSHLLNEKTQSMQVDVGNTVKLDEKGSFIYYVFAIDASGNSTRAYFYIEVV